MSHLKIQRTSSILALMILAGCQTMVEKSERSAEYENDLSPDAIVNVHSQAETLAFWTEARMAEAIPIETPIVSEAEFADLVSMIGDSAPEDRTSEYGIDDNGAGSEVSSSPSRADTSQHPFKQAGKLFFRKGGASYVCSAQFVSGRNILLTAAHCLKDENGNWASNFVFKRAYNGNEPETFGWNCVTTWGNATVNGRYNWAKDYGFIQTSSSNSRGYLGWQTNTGSRTWTAVGYPSNYEGGSRMYRDGGVRGATRSGVTEMQGNLMGPGSSGGAWLDAIGPGNPNYSVGLNSFKYNNNPNSMWGPVFDSEWLRLLNLAKTPGCDG